MSFSLMIRTFVLTLGLLGVIYVMMNLKKEGLSNKTAQVLGVQDESKPSESSTAAQNLSWCRTRVKSLLAAPQGPQVVQEGLKWFRQSQKSAELDTVAVEKWFGQNCSLKIEPLETPAEASGFAPALVIGFIKGPNGQFERSTQGIYRWGKKLFRSTQLDAAIQGLKFLPPVQPQKPGN